MDFLNTTPHPAVLYRAQLHYRDLLMATVIAKASFEVGPDGTLGPVEEPLGINEGDVETPLGVLESDVAPVKEGCDFAVYGGAIGPPGRAVQAMDVRVRIGAFGRALRVTGDRVWAGSGRTLWPTPPLPFTEMPLDYARAFGGVAVQTVQDVEVEVPYSENPGGRGLTDPPACGAGVFLPNVEEVDQSVTAWQDRPLPASLLPLPRTSSLRGSRGIVVDLEAQRTAMRPLAFVWSHPRMHLPRYPAGETVEILGMTQAPLAFRLPTLDLLAHVTLGPAEYRLRLIPDTLCIVPGHRRLWVVARRAFLYQFLPERERAVGIEPAPAGHADSRTTTIAAELAAEARAVPIEPPAPPEEMPLPWDVLREMHPLTEIIESLPLCASG